MGFSLCAGQTQPKTDRSLRLMMTESQPGTMSTEQFCILVFTDRTFHAEKANRKMGKDRDRRVYGGRVAEVDWNALEPILDAKEFRDIKVSRSAPPLMIENSHPYTISVAREKGFQNMEFLNTDGIKPHERQVKPLLQWWKSFRAHMSESKELPDVRCLPDSNKGIFSY